MEIRGWYHDLQQEYDTINRLTTVSLHANSKYRGVDDWVYAERGKPSSLGEIDADGYFVKPICTAIFNEEFNVTASNAWSDMGSDMAGELWNTVRGLAPYAGTVIEGLNKIVDEQKKLSDKDRAEIESSYAGVALMGLSKYAANFLTKGEISKEDAALRDNGENGEAWASKYLNSALTAQGSRYTLYQGTSTNFSNMTMKFTIIPKWSEDGYFLTVNEQLQELYPYFFGEYVPADFSKLFDKGSKSEYVASKLCWQRPPGGYQSDLQFLDAVQKGSLKLKIGAYYSLCNVVVDNISLNFSKQLVKNPKALFDNIGKSNLKFDINNQIVSPMSCDVMLTLRPCTKYSVDSLKNSIEGAGMISELNQVTDTLQNNLQAEMKKSLSAYEYIDYTPFKDGIKGKLYGTSNTISSLEVDKSINSDYINTATPIDEEVKPIDWQDMSVVEQLGDPESEEWLDSDLSDMVASDIDEFEWVDTDLLEMAASEAEEFEWEDTEFSDMLAGAPMDKEVFLQRFSKSLQGYIANN